MLTVIGLGSNVGDRASLLARATELLSNRGIVRALRRSSLLETPALLPPNSPADWNTPFLNMAIAGDTSLEPHELLRELKKIERELGRRERGRWAPREIDLDILAYGDRVIDQITAENQPLRVPHPGLLERAFALVPLAELAPNWRYPVTGAFQNTRADELARRFFDPEPKLMGIVNITPDSFSDGGKFDHPSAALSQAEALIAAGAQVIDLGAESTRPGATPLDSDTEWRRLEPVLKAAQKLRERCLISVDTRHPETARRAIETGIDWINDVSGLENLGLCEMIATAHCDVVVMHSLSVPADRGRVIDSNVDVVGELIRWSEAKLRMLERHGIERSRVILDPGIGFGKTPAQSLELLRSAEKLRASGARLLIGHSRKSFFSMFTGQAFCDRDIETLAASVELARAGVDYLRVHHVEWHARALRVSRALRSREGGRC